MGIVFRRQNLTSVDVRFWRLQTKVYRRQILTSEDDLCFERIKIFIKVVDHNISIQMKRKELTRTFMMISNEKSPLVSMVYAKIIQHCKS